MKHDVIILSGGTEYYNTTQKTAATTGTANHSKKGLLLPLLLLAERGDIKTSFFVLIYQTHTSLKTPTLKCAGNGRGVWEWALWRLRYLDRAFQAVWHIGWAHCPPSWRWLLAPTPCGSCGQQSAHRAKEASKTGCHCWKIHQVSNLCFGGKTSKAIFVGI